MLPESEFEFRREKLQKVLHYALCDLQTLVRLGSMDQMRALLDAIELIPEYMSERRDRDYEATLGGLDEYAERFGGTAERLARVAALDDETFHAEYRSAESLQPV